MLNKIKDNDRIKARWNTYTSTKSQKVVKDQEYTASEDTYGNVYLMGLAGIFYIYVSKGSMDKRDFSGYFDVQQSKTPAQIKLAELEAKVAELKEEINNA